jgi:azurin
MKGYVARNNKTFKFDEVKQLLKESIAQISPENWAKCVEHVKKEEISMLNLDHTIDKTADQFTINLQDSGDSSEISSDCESEA